MPLTVFGLSVFSDTSNTAVRYAYLSLLCFKFRNFKHVIWRSSCIVHFAISTTSIMLTLFLFGIKNGYRCQGFFLCQIPIGNLLNMKLSRALIICTIFTTIIHNRVSLDVSKPMTYATHLPPFSKS